MKTVRFSGDIPLEGGSEELRIPFTSGEPEYRITVTERSWVLCVSK